MRTLSVCTWPYFAAAIILCATRWALCYLLSLCTVSPLGQNSSLRPYSWAYKVSVLRDGTWV